MTQRRILVATGLYPPEIGGPATHTVLMERLLPAEGCAVQVLPFSAVRHLPVGIRHAVYFLRLIPRAVRADIIFAQDTVSVGVPARLAALVTRRTFVVRVPGDHVWEQARQRFGYTGSLDVFPLYPRTPYLLFLRRLQFWVVRTAGVVIVPSEYLKKIVTSWAPQQRIEVLYNGVDVAHMHPTIPSAVPPGKKVVLVGRLVPWKGFEALLDVAARHPAWQVIIIGEGPQRGALETQATALGISERVLFLGRLAHAEMLGWMQVGDVFVLNSSYEGMAHTLAEAAALGVPIVATDIPGNKEVLNETNAWLVPVGDSERLGQAIQEVLDHPEDARIRATRAQAHIQEFSTERTSKKLGALLFTL